MGKNNDVCVRKQEITMDNSSKSAVLQSNLITTSAYNHTSLEENILSYIAFSMGNDLDDNFIVNIQIKELQKFTGKSLSYADVKTVAKQLTAINYSIKWKDIKGTNYEKIFTFENQTELSKNAPKDDDYVILNCIIKSKYISASGQLSLLVNKDMIPFFSQLKEQFTLYNFTDFMRLKTFYSKRFYTMFSMFRSTGVYKKGLEDLKVLFNLEDNYPRYKDFKRRVIVPSLKEINELTEFDVTLEEKKEGRKVETLIFRFKETKRIQEAVKSESPVPKSAAQKVTKVKESPLTDFEAKVLKLGARLNEVGLESSTIDIAVKHFKKNPKFPIWTQINLTKLAIKDGKDFPNKYTLKKFILESVGN